MSKFGRKMKGFPENWEYVEPTLTALENELRDKVNEDHVGMRRVESAWPVHQINWQKSRYIYDLYYTYHRISREIYDYCIENKIVDAALIAKWKKPGYERLCSTFAINTKNSKYGTVSICRVPSSMLDGPVENQTNGCLGCASGPTTRNIFGNKYGQYLAQIQIARENRDMTEGTNAAASAAAAAAAEAASPRGDGASSVWASSEQEADAAVDEAFSKTIEVAAAGAGAKRTAPKYEPPGKRARKK